MSEFCDMCDHGLHHDTDCGEVTGYDHLNGDHECGCPGSLASQLARAWDEGWNASADYMAIDYDGPDDPPNPYDAREARP